MPIRGPTVDVQPFFRLLHMEETARDMYKEDMAKITDPELVELFRTIEIQEERHIEIAREIIKLIR